MYLLIWILIFITFINIAPKPATLLYQEMETASALDILHENTFSIFEDIKHTQLQKSLSSSAADPAVPGITSGYNVLTCPGWQECPCPGFPPQHPASPEGLLNQEGARYRTQRLRFPGNYTDENQNVHPSSWVEIFTIQTWYTLTTDGLLLIWGVLLFVVFHVLAATNTISFTHSYSFPMATFQEQENTQEFYRQSINPWFSCQLHKCCFPVCLAALLRTPPACPEMNVFLIK